MDGIRNVMLAGLIIAMCGRTSDSRGVGWVMAILGAVCMVTVWVIGALVEMVG